MDTDFSYREYVGDMEFESDSFPSIIKIEKLFSASNVSTNNINYICRYVYIGTVNNTSICK